ncbi:hypothetical protein LCGC14_1645570 [marine sediment metagenome]|uniref:Uncharacterized protein n=1 Tax=marine sediment metagenome TaxID=412755 RepID=A0A0F9HYB6_9ZZZZ
MKTSTLIGLGSTLFRSRKFKMIAVGLQFAYLGYKFVKNKKRKKSRKA